MAVADKGEQRSHTTGLPWLSAGWWANIILFQAELVRQDGLHAGCQSVHGD